MSAKPKSIRIEHIEITGYKGIDHLRLDFPKPRMAGDPDIFVLGSANGVGKTSVLECCSLLMLAFILNVGESKFYYEEKSNLLDIVINSRSQEAVIKGVIHYGGRYIDAAITIRRDSTIHPETNITDELRREFALGLSMVDVNFFMESICGLTPNPLITQPFLLFHSYRKIREGGIELGNLLKAESPLGAANYISRKGTPKSIFKNKVLFSMMANANLLETTSAYPTREENINKLNELMPLYANGGMINKLQPVDDNTLDIRVTPKGGGESFSFDALSSGQKEIISTLFMIWHHTKSRPAIVMIDEPELHLNAQWHGSIIRSLTRHPPHNQYIIATHSEYVAEAVNSDRLYMLRPDEGDKNAY